jgi:hypothetical protein
MLGGSSGDVVYGALCRVPLLLASGPVPSPRKDMDRSCDPEF